MSLLRIFENSPDPAFVADETGLLIESNASFSSQFGRAATGSRVFDVWPELKSAWDSFRGLRSFEQLTPLRQDVLVQSGSNTQRIFDLSIVPMADSNRNLLAGMARDVTHDRAERERLVLKATRDDLTGLYVRSQLDLLLDMEIRRSIRRKSTGCFLFIDIDGFKQINDVYGHDAGDEILKSVATVLQGNVRASDVIARVGGDEFGVVLADAELEQGATKAESIVNLIGEVAIGESPNTDHQCVRVSVGVSAYPDHGDNAQRIIQLADKAMYAAKGDSTKSVAVWGK